MPHLKAPAKTNLRLKITGRRADGYHLLDMVNVKLALFDEIDFEITESDIRIETDPSVPSDRGNSLWKIAEHLREASGRRFGLKIRLKKNIPVAAGLGGGTSDAASLLMALNRDLGLDWPLSRLIEIGLEVGADIPFFLVPGAQRVGGIGEVLERLEVPPYPLILVNPGFPISTREAYQWFDDALGNLPGKASESTLTSGPFNVTHPPLVNDLEEVVIPRYPVLARIKDLLKEAGALATQMSGSGPTVFGLFDSEASRDRGYDSLCRQSDPQWWLWQGRSLGGEESNLD